MIWIFKIPIKEGLIKISPTETFYEPYSNVTKLMVIRDAYMCIMVTLCVIYSLTRRVITSNFKMTV